MKNKLHIDKPTIGLEIHVELKTLSKMFCGCPSDHFGKPPNTQTCPTCLGLPGALPVPNKKAVDWTILIGLSLNCNINKDSKFDRKHYFYPDLPKGYQISQYDEPIATSGWLVIGENNSKKIRIRRVHIEEDTGKLQHKKIDGKNVTLIDFNRSGVPLVEIVTEPDLSSGAETKEFAQKLQNILRTLGVSDCDMEKGTMRLEANISWGLKLGYKVEIKNLNSFKFVEKAINYELDRQRELIEKGELPRQETRGWSEKEAKTVTQRFKESEADYRYFPEPDIPPMEFTSEYIEEIKKTLPILPEELKKRFSEEFGVRAAYTTILSATGKLANYSLEVFNANRKTDLTNDQLAGLIVNKIIDHKSLTPGEFLKAALIQKSKGGSNDTEIAEFVEKAIASNQKAVQDFKKGKTNAIFAIVGAVMALSKGKANPQLTRKLIEEKLK